MICLALTTLIGFAGEGDLHETTDGCELPDTTDLPSVEAKQIKERLEIPVIVVGGTRNLEDVRDVFRLGAADFVSLGRPLLTEPDFVNKMKEDPAHGSACIECGYCLLSLMRIPAQCFMGTLPS